MNRWHGKGYTVLEQQGGNLCFQDPSLMSNLLSYTSLYIRNINRIKAPPQKTHLLLANCVFLFTIISDPVYFTDKYVRAGVYIGSSTAK